MKYSDLEYFIKCYNPENRHSRKEPWSEDASRRQIPEIQLR
ncbi:Type I restriction-modification system, DNA-methyltransferase subunit M [Methanosarcina siciliae T4/M]|uniref:Type I restriction-modification system, DNA-methyltransferase subunit M n=1 Tax=Methanosarcina siciliae T4/M TaxID=1434120 RepID=A0A0E3P1A6_9EURY|nr:Type I restriction-modification system, DNA-methyltransferase subunit M [Methanosarcina siciliae T4/M]